MLKTTFQKSNRWALAVNNWRVIPRLALVAFMGFTAWQCVWFAMLPEPTAEQSAYVIALIGGASVFTNFYVKTGSVKSDNNEED